MTYTALHDLASRCLSVSTAGISPFHSIHLVTLNSSHFLKCAIPAPLPPLHMLFNAVLLLFAWLSSLTLHIAGKQSPREGFYIPPRRGNELPPQSPGRLFCLCHTHITVHRTLAIFSDYKLKEEIRAMLSLLTST